VYRVFCYHIPTPTGSVRTDCLSSETFSGVDHVLLLDGDRVGIDLSAVDSH
jgi:hypothetical protein